MNYNSIICHLVCPKPHILAGFSLLLHHSIIHLLLYLEEEDFIVRLAQSRFTGAIALFCFPMAPNESQQVSEDLTLKPHFDCVEEMQGFCFSSEQCCQHLASPKYVKTFIPF